MSSGLQRRRVAGSSTPATQSNDSSDFPDNNNTSIQGSRNGFTEDGKKIAYDPDDINTSVDEQKQPKLTLMEEILLLGLNDKLVCSLVVCFYILCLSIL